MPLKPAAHRVAGLVPAHSVLRCQVGRHGFPGGGGQPERQLGRARVLRAACFATSSSGMPPGSFEEMSVDARVMAGSLWLNLLCQGQRVGSELVGQRCERVAQVAGSEGLGQPDGQPGGRNTLPLTLSRLMALP